MDSIVMPPSVSVDAAPPLYGELVARHTRDAIIVTGIDGRLVWANPAFERLSGYRLSEVLSRKPGSFLQGPSTDPATVRHVSTCLSERAPVKVEIVNYTKSGEPYWIEMDISPVFDASGHHSAFIAVERDVSDRKELFLTMERRRDADTRRREERRVLAETSEWLFSADTLKELRRILEAALPRLLPRCEGTLFVYRNSRDRLEPLAVFGGMDAPTDLMPADCWGLRRGRSHTYGGQTLDIPCDHRATPDKGSICVPLLAHGETLGMLVVVFNDVEVGRQLEPDARADLDERRQLVLTSAKQIGLAIANVRLRAELRSQSTRDVLTGLPNRRSCLEELANAFAHASRTGTSVAVVSLDVDHFKAVNDTYGHATGDAVLKAVGSLLNQVLGSRGTACRYGGEEFIVILPGLSPTEGLAVAEELRTRIAAETELAHVPLPAVTVSAGVAGFPDHGSTPEAVMDRADAALYQAKRSGRNRAALVS